MNQPLKIGKDTLLDINSVEYQWIRSLASDGNSPGQINDVIQRCLGGNPDLADTMRQVAMRQVPINQLLRCLTAMPERP
ncbi:MULTISPECIES: hypothetical protein [Photobacterium]|uniref:Uncharacterized protein n=1 Tax=Photobacterium ganghwense TaxID=320778 RepID=A0A0J1HJG9_9GAMM|nr:MULTISPECIES: hypothetical protein [Photobacterium]KLV11748.1 hypothetical protein ABT57_00370 [Photobacterium ganghwense]MBV1843069.1 hypothetical protein [Photobacterium ganghwense]PSU04607.1 hypothetical protein C9I92_23875 [Photobacterium ganghwense]QSV14613.1 hypothetical protein FH974_02940 [Photobacterium ganghwense]